MGIDAQHVQIPVEMHDPLQVKQGVHEVIAELDHQRFLPVRVDDLMHLHGPHEQEIAFHQFIGALVHPEDVRLPGTHQQDFAIGMPVRLVAPGLITRGEVKGAHPVEPIIFILAVIHGFFLRSFPLNRLTGRKSRPEGCTKSNKPQVKKWAVFPEPRLYNNIEIRENLIYSPAHLPAPFLPLSAHSFLDLAPLNLRNLRWIPTKIPSGI